MPLINLMRKVLSIIAPGAHILSEPYEYVRGMYWGRRASNGMEIDVVLIPVIIPSRALRVIGQRIPKKYDMVSAILDENGVLRLKVEDTEQFFFEATPSGGRMYIAKELLKQP